MAKADPTKVIRLMDVDGDLDEAWGGTWNANLVNPDFVKFAVPRPNFFAPRRAPAKYQK